MGTKNNPDKYDCYTMAHPDEPIFTLRGNDRDAALVVKMWAFLRLQQVELGLRDESEKAQVSSAFMIATEMEIWYKKSKAQKEHDGMLFDYTGHPIPIVKLGEPSV